MITGEERREGILEQLRRQAVPLSGRWLAGRYRVSRQVIVQDIALLRAAGEPILSTSRGYMLSQSETVYRTFKLIHPEAQTQEELCTIVDLGGRVINVMIDHPIYGRLEADLDLDSRRKVQDFMGHTRREPDGTWKPCPACAHYHTVAAGSTAILDLIEQELDEKGFLLEARP